MVEDGATGAAVPATAAPGAPNPDEPRREVSLLMTVIEAKELQTDGLPGSCDPYAAVMVNHREEFRTKTAFNTREPTWDEEIDADLSVDFRSVEVVVWDENRVTKNTPLGKVCFSREYLAARGRQTIEQWFPLSAADTEGSVSGDINLELTYYPPTAPSTIHTLTVAVMSGRGLVSKDTNGYSDPYIVLHLLPDPEAESTQHTKIVLKSLNPKYNEVFTFHFEGEVRSRVLHVSCWDWDRFTGDDFMGHFSVPVADLPGNCTVNDWFMLLPAPVALKSVLSSSDSEGKLLSVIKQPITLLKRHSRRDMRPGVSPDITTTRNFVKQFQQLPQDQGPVRDDNTKGSIRLKIQYTEETVLPRSSYAELVALSMENHYLLAAQLGRWSANREEAARTLVRIFDDSGHAIEFLYDMIDHEVEATVDPNTIFRGNSMASKGIDVFMKTAGFSYLQATLGNLIREIVTAKRPCEVDPTRLAKGEELEKNWKNLEGYVQSAITAVLQSAHMCPQTFCDIFYHIRETVQAKFPEHAHVKYVSVSGFIFLRFFCPAILGPKLFNLWPEPIDRKQARTLTLVAKVLQNLGNLVEFGYKEEYMRNMNPIIVANLEGVKAFIDSISIPKPGISRNINRRTLDWDAPASARGVSGKLDYARECFRLFQHYDQTRSKILENVPAGAGPLISRFDLVLEDLRVRHRMAEEMLQSKSPMGTMSPRFSSRISVVDPRSSRSLAPPEVAVGIAPRSSRTVGPAPAAASASYLASRSSTAPAAISRSSLAVPTTAPAPAGSPAASDAGSLHGLDSLIDDLESFSVGVPMKATKHGSVPVSQFESYKKQVGETASASASADGGHRPVRSSNLSQPPVSASSLDALDALMDDLDNTFRASMAGMPLPAAQPAAPAPAAPTPQVPLSTGDPALDEIIAQAQKAARRTSEALDRRTVGAAFEASALAPAAPAAAAPPAAEAPQDDMEALDDLMEDFDMAAQQATEANALVSECLSCGMDIGAAVFHSWAGFRWHAEHFCCSVCSVSLEGAKFYFHDRQLFCEADYQKTFVCAHCSLQITDSMVEALGRKWHARCFRCTECGIELTGSFMADEHKRPYCREHFMSRKGMVCGKCSGPIDSEFVNLNDKKLHARCVTCTECGAGLAGKAFVIVNDELYCPHHFRCVVCNEPVDSQIVYALGKRFHVNHFNCVQCQQPLVGQPFYPRNGMPVCKNCHGA